MRFVQLLLYFTFFSHLCLAKQINLAIRSAPGSMSPYFSFDANSQNILALIHTSLIDFDENMEVICRLCENYSEREEKSRYIIQFTLKKGQTFQDGSEITSEDIKKSWEIMVSDKIRSPFRFAFKKITHIKIIDRYKVELIYEGFHLSALSDLFLLKIVKSTNFDQISEFRDLNLVAGGEFSLIANDPFRILIESRTKDRKLAFYVVKDETTLAMKLMNGEIDLLISSISPRKIDYLKNKIGDQYQFLESSGSNFVYLAPNFESKFFSNEKFRLAFSYLIPKNLLIQHKLKNTSENSFGFFSASFKGYDYLHRKMEYDLKKANKILDELAPKRDGNGIRLFNDHPVVLDWKISSDQSTRELVNSLRPYFKRAGIKIHLSELEWGIFKRERDRGNFDLVLGSWVGFKSGDILEYALHSQKIPPLGGNRGRYKNKVFDEIVEKAVSLSDKDKYKSQFANAQDVANLDFAYFNLWHPKVIWISKKCLSGLKLHPTGSFQALNKLENNCENSHGH